VGLKGENDMWSPLIMKSPNEEFVGLLMSLIRFLFFKKRLQSSNLVHKIERLLEFLLDMFLKNGASM
jgi:hypothetical protein